MGPPLPPAPLPSTSRASFRTSPRRHMCSQVPWEGLGQFQETEVRHENEPSVASDKLRAKDATTHFKIMHVSVF